MAIHSVRWNDPMPAVCRGGALTIGNFDGVHRGHQALLGELQRQARAAGGPAVAMTFNPPPVQLLRPEAMPAALTTLADRTRLMQAHGAEEVVVMQTTHELLRHSAQQFFEAVVLRGFDAKVVVPGFNFAFGHNREGTVERLLAMCQAAGRRCVPVPPLTVGEQPVSSSRIRAELLDGNVAAAAELLGRPYRVQGTVTTGQRRGQALGFPTANLEGVQTLVPANGVYAARVSRAEGTWAGAANIGPNPTFGEQVRKIEVHLIDFQGDLYGAWLSMDFIERLRETRKFAGPAELVQQLQADIAAARRLVHDGPQRPMSR